MREEIYLQYGYRRWYASPECATGSSDQTGSADRSVTGRGIGMTTKSLYDDIIKPKHFPCCWPFVRGIHRSPVNSPHKGQWRGALMFSLISTWTSKQSRRRWFETPSRSLLHRVLAYNGMFIICSSYWSWVLKNQGESSAQIIQTHYAELWYAWWPITIWTD